MLAQTAHLTGMTEDFLFNIQSGYLKGFEAYRAFGLQDMCAIGEDNYLWEGRVKYIYPTTNEKMYINSTSNSDLGEVRIFGLYEDTNGDWLEKTIKISLNGTTLITTPEMEFIRIYRLDYLSTDGSDNLGDISLYNSNTTIDITTLKAQIQIGNNSSRMAQYTVPSNKVGFVYRLYRSVKKNQDADFDYQIRPFGSGFRTLGVASSFASSSQEDVSFEPLPPKTDLQIRVDTENNNTEARGSFHLITVNFEHLELKRIENFNIET